MFFMFFNTFLPKIFMISFIVNNLLILIINIILNYFFLFIYNFAYNAYPDIALTEV